MIAKSITYTGFDDLEHTETFYFHLSKIDLISLDASYKGGLAGKLHELTETKDGMAMMRTFAEIVGQAYGSRGDGTGSDSGFHKSQDQTDAFLNGAAFDQMITDFIEHPDSMMEFVNGLLPADLRAGGRIEKAVEKRGLLPADVEATKRTTVENVPGVGQSGLKNPLGRNGEPLPWAFREPTREELTQMNKAQLFEVTQRMMSSWKPPVL